MTSFKDLAQMRRSHRKFSSQEIDPEHLKLILRAALMSPTSKSQRAWQFVVVDDPLDIEKLSDAKNMGSQFLKGAPVAIAVLGDPMQNDCWVEDGSIAAISMQYQAEELGLGSCWIQMRGRGRRSYAERLLGRRWFYRCYLYAVSGRGAWFGFVLDSDAWSRSRRWHSCRRCHPWRTWHSR